MSIEEAFVSRDYSSSISTDVSPSISIHEGDKTLLTIHSDGIWEADSDAAVQRAAKVFISEVKTLRQDDLEQAERRGRSAGLQEAAERADSIGHHWSGTPAVAVFAVADQIRALDDTPL